MVALASMGALGGVECFSSRASAQSSTLTQIFAGQLTTQEADDVAEWGSTYFAKREGTSVGFYSFSNPAMNHHLFNPLYATRQTLANLQTVSLEDCQEDLITATSNDPVRWTKRTALKNSMVANQLSTDPVANPDGTFTHVSKILDSLYLTSVATYYDQTGKLISEYVPLDLIVAASADPTLTANISDDNITTINALAMTLPALAPTLGGLTETEKLATAATGAAAQSRADKVKTQIQQILTTRQSTATIHRYDAQFGVYGLLPIWLVQFNDCYILIDGITGNVSAPRENGSNLAPQDLLSHHSDVYSSGMAIRVRETGFGCQLVGAPTWKPLPPPGSAPRPARPTLPFPLVPFAPALFDTSRPGWWSAYACATVTFNPLPTIIPPVSICVCESWGVYTSTTPGFPIVYVRSRCETPGTCAAIPFALPPSHAPGSPTPGVPPAWTCIIEYYW